MPNSSRRCRAWCALKSTTRCCKALRPTSTTTIAARIGTADRRPSSTATSTSTTQMATPWLPKTAPKATPRPTRLRPMSRTSIRTTRSTSTRSTINTACASTRPKWWWARTTSSICAPPTPRRATATKWRPNGISSASPCANISRRWATSVTSLPSASCACS